MLVKICGLLTPEDAVAADEAGADMLGVIFADAWRRRTVAEAQAIFRAVPTGAERVGVFVNAPLEEVREIARLCYLDRIQLGGSESPEYCAAIGRPAVKTIRLPREQPNLPKFDVDLFHLDTDDIQHAGGTGKTWDYSIARNVNSQHRALLAGGLTPDNVAAAIATSHPFGVDVSSGVETNQAKDPDKIAMFVQQAQAAFKRLKADS